MEKVITEYPYQVVFMALIISGTQSNGSFIFSHWEGFWQSGVWISVHDVMIDSWFFFLTVALKVFIHNIKYISLAILIRDDACWSFIWNRGEKKPISGLKLQTSKHEVVFNLINEALVKVQEGRLLFCMLRPEVYFSYCPFIHSHTHNVLQSLSGAIEISAVLIRWSHLSNSIATHLYC